MAASPTRSTTDPHAASADLPERFVALSSELAGLYAASQPPDETDDDAPPQLAEAFARLAETLERLGQPDGAALDETPQETATELGEYALNLCQSALDRAGQLSAESLVEGFQTLTLDTALWVAGRGGWILTLEPVVNALAALANHTHDESRLAALFRIADKVRAAVTPAIRRDLEKTDPGRPWRLLNMNRAIVATRAHRPELMVAAFDDLVAEFPEDAPQFFAQGMEQMDRLNYPGQVREVMEKYYLAWSVKRALH
jgi:hypothetical protein